MVTGKSHTGPEPFRAFPPTAQQPPSAVATSPPSKLDLASWWRQFKKNTRKEDNKVEKPQGIFGVPLNVSIKYANVAISLTNDNGESFIYGYVPIVVAKCGVFLKEKATDVEGIFRLNGSAKRIKDLQAVFDSPERYGKGLDWTGYTVHDAANVLRRYLNQLPEPIVPLEFYERFREPLRMYQQQAQENASSTDSPAEPFDHAKAVAAYQQLIRELPPLNKQLLLYILDLLAVFASKSELNRMPSANLSAIFQPGMISHPQHDMSPEEYKLSQDVLIFLIENQDHFLFGMNGTAADEQTLKEVEGGLMPRNTSTVRRSVSSASGGSFRKFESMRRNVSVSSKNSRGSNNAPSPATPTSAGVHRSNTLPSKMSPAMQASRYAKPSEPAAATPSALASSIQNSRSASRTPPPREEGSQQQEQQQQQQQSATGQDGAPATAIGFAYVHSSTHGPIPKTNTDPIQSTNKEAQPEFAPRAVSPSPPPAVVTPSRERKFSSLFSKSPPPGEQKEARQPNRLKKKRIPGSASESAQSSSQSLQAAASDTSLIALLHTTRSPPETNDAGGATPKPSNAVFLHENSSQTPDTRQDSTANNVENGHPPAAENSLKPYGSRTPSMNSRSSFTDQSDFDQPDEAAKERKENRRSWRFHRSSKQVGLGLASPPLLATNPGAQHSTSSIGSGSWHQTSKSSPTDLQAFANDPSAQPLSLDAAATSKGHPTSQGSETEKRGLFDKLKAKVAQVRDGVKDRDSENDEAKSPVQSEAEKSASNHALSAVSKDSLTSRPTAIEMPKDVKDEHPSTPVSPSAGSGLPPPIPEEPNSPVSPVAAATPEQKKDHAGAFTEEGIAQTEVSAASETPKDANVPS